MSKNTKLSIKFPDKFLLGVGTSAYQIEGGWDADGKAPSIWDSFFHKKAFNEYRKQVVKEFNSKNFGVLNKQIINTSVNISLSDEALINGDVACDSYNLLEEDIKNLVNLKVNTYRFSISWPRVLPNGDSRTPNLKGVQYYQKLIQKLLDNNIQPLVTIYHWDLPNTLQELGGWTNPRIVDYFKDYATFIFKTFGDKVKLWCTINEPKILSMGYASSAMAPGMSDIFNGIGDSMAWRNLLLAHAAAYNVYQNSFKAYQQGEITISLDTSDFSPVNPDDKDHQEAAAKAIDYNVGVFIEPLVNGEFPESVLDAFERTNKDENLNIRRLITFTDEEKKDIIGSYDFISFNYYNAIKVKPKTDEDYATSTTLNAKDMDFVTTWVDLDDTDETCKGFTRIIEWLRNKCNDPVLFVTENGYYEKPNANTSFNKIRYHHGILTALYQAMVNGANVKGYTAWSFMDSLEWAQGYNKSLYGILSVDFTDKKKRPRSEKPSTEFFRKFFETKTLPPIAQ